MHVSDPVTNALRRLLDQTYPTRRLSGSEYFVDFIFEGPAIDSMYDVRQNLPKAASAEYIGNAPGLPVPNGKFLYLCRCREKLLPILLADTTFSVNFLAASWEELFEVDYPYWDHVFDVETRRDDSMGNLVYWRGKAFDLTAADTVVAFYPPSVFAGDDVPNLRIDGWQVKHLLRRTAFGPPRDLLIVVDSISDELMKKLAEDPYELHQLSARKFEVVVGKILEANGWRVELTPKTKDGGYDIFAIQKDNLGISAHWIVECKKYSAERKIGVEIVRSLLGVKNDKHVANAMIATTSRFTAGAEKYKNSRYDLELVDFCRLSQWLEKTKV